MLWLLFTSKSFVIKFHEYRDLLPIFVWKFESWYPSQNGSKS